MYRKLLLIPLLLACLVPIGRADEPDQEGPGRGVGRVSLLNGEVSVRRGDSGEMVAAGLNAPVMAQDSIVSGPASRAEVQFDSGNIVRVGADSEVRLSDLQYRRYQIQIARGTIAYSMPREYRSEVEIDTPSVAVRPLVRGLYRISVMDDGTSEITVRAGEVEVSTQSGSQRLGPGRTMLVRGDPANPEFQVVGALGFDEWDRFNQARDQEIQSSESYAHVSPDIYGAEDLDRNGRWIQDAEYGSVWTPSVSPDWAPYREGRWSWVDYYGWTWVSADPWGWAPYHYGRWFHRDTGWCWFPGEVGAGYHHYWRPALVAFFGFGGGYGGVGVGLGFGNVGWVPLAPHEVYHPWFGSRYYGGYRNNAFVNNTTIVNKTNIYNSYRNARVMNGVTAVNYNNFGRGRVAGLGGVPVNQLRQASLVRGQLPVTPDRNSLRWNDRATPAGLTPRALDRTQFRSVRPAQSVDRVPFAQQQQHTQQLAQHFGLRGPVEGAGQRVPATREQYPSGGNRFGSSGQAVQGGGRYGTAAGSGWREAGPSANPSYAGQAAVPNGARPLMRENGNSGSGWRQFGNPGQVSGARPDTAGRPSYPNQGAVQAPNANRDWSRFGEPSHLNGMNIERSNPRWDRPAAPQVQTSPASGGWGRFGQQDRGASQPAVRQPARPEYSAPRSYAPQQPQYNSPRGYTPQQPQYSSPRSYAPQPHYSAPRNYSPQPRYSAPQSRPAPQPQYSAPRNFSAPQPQSRAPHNESHSAPSGGGSPGNQSHSSGNGHGNHH